MRKRKQKLTKEQAAEARAEYHALAAQASEIAKKYLAEHKEVKIDYIHGESVVYDLCKQENVVGFIFEGMKKSELFPTVIKDGALPRKTFSMGHAEDKRFYVECRKISK